MALAAGQMGSGSGRNVPTYVWIYQISSGHDTGLTFCSWGSCENEGASPRGRNPVLHQGWLESAAAWALHWDRSLQYQVSHSIQGSWSWSYCISQTPGVSAACSAEPLPQKEQGHKTWGEEASPDSQGMICFFSLSLFFLFKEKPYTYTWSKCRKLLLNKLPC